MNTSPFPALITPAEEAMRHYCRKNHGNLIDAAFALHRDLRCFSEKHGLLLDEQFYRHIEQDDPIPF